MKKKKKKVEIYLYVLYSQQAFPFPSRKGGGREGGREACSCFFFTTRGGWFSLEPICSRRRRSDAQYLLNIFSNPPWRLVQKGSSAPETMLIEIVRRRLKYELTWTLEKHERSLVVPWILERKKKKKKRSTFLGVFLFSGGGIHFFFFPLPSRDDHLL